MDLHTLRAQHPVFTYQAYHHHLTPQGLELTFEFSISPDITFRPQIVIEGMTQVDLDRLPPGQLENLVFHLGLIEIPSYWKATCSPVIKLAAGYLSEDQIKWWKKLLLKGLGEFFYRNEIDFTDKDFITFETTHDKAPLASQASAQSASQPSSTSTPSLTTLVPLGGGKDSIVTLELLKHSQVKVVPFSLNPITAVTELLRQNPDLRPLIARRTIDPALLELNRRGYLNGHTPFSAYLAFTTYLVATLKGLPYIALSNERSASEGNVEYLGTIVNHQYSKSLEFENDFRAYARQWLAVESSPSPSYFSFLRPLHELQIGQLFVQLTADHHPLRALFRSCNRGQKTNSWCGECSKCLFAWLMLFPFLGETELIDIFGQNLFEKESLIDEALDLIHPERVKPWECVGTRQESQVALYLSLKLYQEQGQPLPLLLEKMKPEIANISDDDAQRLLNDWNQQHNLPTTFETLLKNALRPLLIFGLGREGLSTYRFLRAQFPDKEITLIDEKPLSVLDPTWQRLLATDAKLSFEQPRSLSPMTGPVLVFRSAGIRRHQVEELFPDTEVSSNTQLFFETVNKLKSQGHQLIIIGITGTKGKSTTSSAIHHVLKESGFTSFLGGNIGKPPLEVLQEAHASLSPPQPIYLVLELSSHQLSDLPFSPDIAVIQDILPEHLDYYADFDEYWTAKSQIARFQTEEDVILYNQDSETATKIAQLSPGTRIGFGQTDINQKLIPLVALAELKVVGWHNYLNLLPSLIIGQHLGISNDQIAAALKTFTPLPHRLEKVAEINGVTFINDSLATNPPATIAALKAFDDKPLILIAGGYNRGLDYSDLGSAIINSKVKAVILFKPTGEKIHQAIEAALRKSNVSSPVITFVETMEEAVTQAWQVAEPGEVVLMSPASASFGTFKDYADRGEQFKQEVTQQK
ncbi:MAG TPA: UDP-N-acetylmuramoyl-L-alanine--D-glutamate ligase [Patescibacteria group bacterium]